MLISIAGPIVFSAATIILSGLWLGPDYRMNVHANGYARIQWLDQSTATVQFETVRQDSSGHAVVSGTVLSSTDQSKMSAGDRVLIITANNELLVTTPIDTGSVERWHNTVCWQGFNLEEGQYIYPC